MRHNLMNSSCSPFPPSALPARSLATLALASLSLCVPSVAQQQGLRIFQPIGAHQTQMVDEQGTIVHTWPGMNNVTSHIGPDGSLWRGATTGTIPAGGATGRLQRLAFDGTLLWDHLVDGPVEFAHHDIQPLPNGNVLVIAWDRQTAADAIAAGRDPATLNVEWWPDAVLELQQTGPTTAAVVWEWHLADHLIQDFDPTKSNLGVVADHPELLDINFPPVTLVDGDWNHANGIDYDPINDWIILSARAQSEIYLIDHSTTTAEAAGHTGGRRGKGGDILYRWGNPQAYRAGTSLDRQLFFQHDPRFIPAGYPGAGHITLFNNDYIAGTQSAVFELDLPLDVNGDVVLAPSGVYGPTSPFWVFTTSVLYSPFISSAQRLPNGNTLICSGGQGTLFEVTPTGQVVWFYQHPGPVALFQASLVERSLWADTDVLSSGGGQVNLDHLVGSGHAGEYYLLLGSISGTSPGTTLPGGVLLPLNFDYLTYTMSSYFNTGMFVDSIGTLDALGGGSSTILVPSGTIPAALIGTQVSFAHVIFNSSLQILRASNPTNVIIAP
jgi:hypothetical protein